MDVRLSPEQHALRSSVAAVVDRLGPHAVGQLDDRERAEKLDAAVHASGWRELRVAEDGGAPLASGVEASIVAEELARGLADAPFLGPTLAAELRRLAGAPPATSAETILLAPSLGDLVVVPAAGAEPPAGVVAIDAEGAGAALVLRSTVAGDELARLPVRPVGERMDLTRPTAVLDAASPTQTVGGRALTGDDLTSWTALGLALTSAELVGTMRGAIDLAVGYAAARRQFDRPVGSFQAVQHLLADAFVLMEGARSVALHAAWAVDARTPDEALGAAAAAKAYSARAARTVCETAIQVHGGIGNTWECLAHVHLRRALLSTAVLGGEDLNIGRVLARHGIGADGGLR